MSEYRFLVFRLGSALRRREPWKAILLIAALPLITGFAETGSQPLAPELCEYTAVAENIGVNAYPNIPESLEKYENACELHAINGIRFAGASYAYRCNLSISRSAEIIGEIDKTPETASQKRRARLSPDEIEKFKASSEYKKSKILIDAFSYDFVSEALHMNTTYISRSSHWCCEDFSVIFLLDEKYNLLRILKTLDELDAENISLTSVDAAILWARMHLKLWGNLCSGNFREGKNEWILEDIPLNDECTPTGTKTLAIGFDGRIETLNEQKPKDQQCHFVIE